MSKRVIWSITLMVLAVGVLLVFRNAISGLMATFFLLAMLLMWSIPINPSASSSENRGPGFMRIGMAFVGIGLGLFASITAVLILPPQLFPLALLATGIGILIWFFVSQR